MGDLGHASDLVVVHCACQTVVGLLLDARPQVSDNDVVRPLTASVVSEGHDNRILQPSMCNILIQSPVYLHAVFVAVPPTQPRHNYKLCVDRKCCGLQLLVVLTRF